ncbi:hypothetical protein M3Y99_01314200 [Aphelenchoides fujianensis]|nr:hypothetical protein M3Y99_01314200 [Aphelenchoides fujianensis]
MMERTAKRLRNFEVKLGVQKAQLKRARQTIQKTAEWKIAVIDQITQLADLSANAPLSVQSTIQSLLETALDGPPCEMEEESPTVSPTPTETTDEEEEAEEQPKQGAKNNADDEAAHMPLHPPESPLPFNQPLGGGLPIAETKHPPPNNSRLLELENGESNCFVIAALHVIQAMSAVASGLLDVPDDAPRCLRAMSDILNHRTHSVNDLRRLLGADFSDGYGDVKDVLEHILTNWIPPELQAYFRFHVSKTTECCGKPTVKQRDTARLVLHQSINRDDFLEDVVEHDKPVMCTACDDVITPRIQLTTNNAAFKYLVVLLHNRDRCDVQLRTEVVQMFGRRMQVTAAVEYKKSEKHYVVWRRVDDRRNPWRLVDSLKEKPIARKFLGTLRDVVVLLLQVLPEGVDVLHDKPPTSIDDNDVIMID